MNELLSINERRRLLALKTTILSNEITVSDWKNIELLTGYTRIGEHPRLLCSLGFGDDDYESCVFEMLLGMYKTDPAMIGVVEEFLMDKEGNPNCKENIFKLMGKMLVHPSVFEIRHLEVEPGLVSVMMPLDKAFDGVYATVVRASNVAGYKCLRADEVWRSQTIIQDIFDLICRASVVVADLANKNPNVCYELGIAHTLGKTVIPITQSINDIPFDICHHRVLRYLNNNEGLVSLESSLESKLRDVKS